MNRLLHRNAFEPSRMAATASRPRHDLGQIGRLGREPHRYPDIGSILQLMRRLPRCVAGHPGVESADAAESLPEEFSVDTARDSDDDQSGVGRILSANRVER